MRSNRKWMRSRICRAVTIRPNWRGTARCLGVLDLSARSRRARPRPYRGKGEECLRARPFLPPPRPVAPRWLSEVAEPGKGDVRTPRLVATEQPFSSKRPSFTVVRDSARWTRLARARKDITPEHVLCPLQNGTWSLSGADAIAESIKCGGARDH